MHGGCRDNRRSSRSTWALGVLLLSFYESLAGRLADRIEEEINDAAARGSDLGRHRHAGREAYVALIHSDSGFVELHPCLKHEAALLVLHGVARAEAGRAGNR